MKTINDTDFFYNTQFDDYVMLLPGIEVTGYIVDTQQQPVANAVVIVPLRDNVAASGQYQNTSSICQAHSDQNGKVVFIAPAHCQRMIISCEHYELEEHTLRGREFVVTLSKQYAYQNVKNVNPHSMLSVYKYGIWAFGKKNYFRQYLNSQVAVLNYERPCELPAEHLYDAISQIVHGVCT